MNQLLYEVKSSRHDYGHPRRWFGVSLGVVGLLEVKSNNFINMRVINYNELGNYIWTVIRLI